MSDPLAPLLTDGVVEEVVARLKSGKEADLYLVQHAGEIVAAKIYKERHARSFRNNAAYKEGRQVRNTRTQRAMDRGSRFGQVAAEEAWKVTESETLQRLHAAGVRVPQPILFYEGVLLMEVVVDHQGHPAPRLIDAHVPREVAAPFYADLRAQAVKMLTCDLIHGDLSPYNVLLAWNGPTIIDFPQVIGAAHNRQAEAFFARDLQTIWRFFAAIDPALQKHRDDALEIWRAYERRELTADFTPSGRPFDAGRPPRRGWGREAPRSGPAPKGALPQRGAPPKGGPPKGGPPKGAPQGGSGPRGGPGSRSAGPSGSGPAPAGSGPGGASPGGSRRRRGKNRRRGGGGERPGGAPGRRGPADVVVIRRTPGGNDSSKD